MVTFKQFFLESAQCVNIKEAESGQGVVFSAEGCSIGVAHGCNIYLNDETLDRIKDLVTPSTKFWPEGAAGAEPSLEPGMVTFMEKYFPDHTVQRTSWDSLKFIKDDIEDNFLAFLYVMYANHESQKTLERLYKPADTMFDSVLEGQQKNKIFDLRGPTEEELTQFLSKSGYLKKFQEPYDKEELFDLLNAMENDTWSGQLPSNSWLGKQAALASQIRNASINDLMSQGGVCFVGGGHTDEIRDEYGYDWVKK